MIDLSEVSYGEILDCIVDASLGRLSPYFQEYAEVPIQLTGQECGCACSVIYDGKHKEFILVPGEVSLVYLNGQLLSEPQLLADGDQMCVGEEQLCFQSFCGEYR